MSLAASSAHGALLRSAVEVARRQWRGIGAPVGAAERVAAVVDPEALLHLSVALAPREPWLMDAMAAWMALHSSLLSVQRVRNLAADFPPSGRERLAALARVAMDEGKDARWKPLADGRPADPRPRRAPGRAIQRRFTNATALLLQLRLGMGVGVKADVLAFLLATNGAPASAAEIAEAIRYTVVAVRRAADEMTSARFVRAARGERGGDGPTTYAAPPDAWAAVLGIDPPFPPWRGWRERFALVADLAERGDVSVTDAELLEELHADAFDFDGAPPPEAGWQVSVAALARWMSESV
jgi:hypothetical protein